MKKRYFIYIILVWVILIVPFAGMTFWPTTETSENTELAEWPKWKEDGTCNQDYLEEVGEYFEDHFAFRQHFVTANALLRGKIFRTGSTDQVIVGEDDWLYFGGTINDYRGRNLLSERELYNVVHNIRLMQSYVQQNGSQFVLMVIPNKNTLYDEAMPYYIKPGDTSNLERLTGMLSEQGVEYIDVKELFQKENDVLYFHRDSHWNNKGAVLAYNALMEKLGREHETYLNVPYELEKIHIGDIDEMLYPYGFEKEEEYIYDKKFSYQYVNDVKDNMDAWVQTENLQKDGSILMYRDSFGESILPFVADEMGQGYFSRLVPYNLTQTEELHPQYVVVEKVERNIQDFAKSIPIMEGPMIENQNALEVKTKSSVKTQKEGSYLSINGQIEKKYLEDHSNIYVAIRNKVTQETRTYQAFHMITKNGDGNGYQLYVKGGSVPKGELHISVITDDGMQTKIVASKDMNWE
ncbi:MAG: hypothetical protein Q4B74_04300 [Eubacteriales bacterium]|mgnify:CR=1 FL=1|nr:hypothetical protein [Eubacteriales bacterium]